MQTALNVRRRFTEIVEETSTSVGGVMKVVVRNINNGKLDSYKVMNGTYYSVSTPDALIPVLERIRSGRRRCRFFWGDQETGYDYAEELDTMGTIGRSTGECSIPLLIASSRSMGGIALSTSSIVKITHSKGGDVIWQHPAYQKPEFKIVVRGEAGFPEHLNHLNYEAAVFRTNDRDKICPNYANFQKREEAKGYVSFIRGETNSRAYGLNVVKK